MTSVSKDLRGGPGIPKPHSLLPKVQVWGCPRSDLFWWMA